MPLKQEIKNLLAQNKTKEAINKLLKFTKSQSIHNEVIQQSAKFKQYESTKRLGTESVADLNIALSRIHNALLSIVDQLPTLELQSNKVHNESNTNSQSEDMEKPISSSTKIWKYITAAAVIIGIFGSLAEILNFIDIFPNKEPQSSTNTVTVLVHGKEGKDDKVLPNRGIVYLIYGNAKIPEQINNEGEATFKQIPETFFANDASVEISFEDPEGEPWKVAYRDSSYQLEKEKSIYLQVNLQGMEEIKGIVKDFETGEFLEGVVVRVFGKETHTDKYGQFILEIPEKERKQFITIRASKEGYENWELSNIPTTTDQETIIPMKKEE